MKDKKDGVISLGGYFFDEIPSKDYLSKRDYREYKEGKLTIKELWLSFYEYEGSISRQSILLTMTSRGKCELDGKVLKGEDIETAKKIFASLGL